MLYKRKPRYRGYTDFPEGLEMFRGVFFFGAHNVWGHSWNLIVGSREVRHPTMSQAVSCNEDGYTQDAFNSLLRGIDVYQRVSFSNSKGGIKINMVLPFSSSSSGNRQNGKAGLAG